MSQFLPLFPLNLVAFPGESLNLHIFEPRYISLINDCLKEESTFGIPSYVLTKIELGTEMKIIEVEKKYEDGRMDIKTKGQEIFKVTDFQNPWAGKAYAAGKVSYKDNDMNIDLEVQKKMVDMAYQFFNLINVTNSIHLNHETTTYDIGHKIGLKREEEYELLKIKTEEKRANFVIEHLENIIKNINRASQAREIIMMNGHFKNLDPLKF